MMNWEIEETTLKKYTGAPSVNFLAIPEGIKEIGVAAFQRLSKLKK